MRRRADKRQRMVAYSIPRGCRRVKKKKEETEYFVFLYYKPIVAVMDHLLIATLQIDRKSSACLRKMLLRTGSIVLCNSIFLFVSPIM